MWLLILTGLGLARVYQGLTYPIKEREDQIYARDCITCGGYVALVFGTLYAVVHYA